MWLIQAENGVDRSWVGDCSETQAEALRVKLEGEWDSAAVKERIREQDVQQRADEIHGFAAEDRRSGGHWWKRREG
jgi:hypothetical protein